MNKKQPSRARRVALGGILSAVSLLFLLAGGLIPVGTFAAPIFAGLCLMPIAMDIGTKTALLCYAAVSILGVVIVPDTELVLFFIVLCGYYPILYPTLGRIKSRVLRWVVKLLLFNAAVLAVYCLLFFFFTGPTVLETLTARAPWYWAALLAVGNVTFVLYDVLIDKLKIVYVQRFRKYLFR
ncbi:MAG: hypothetical protein AB7V55_01850 [Oscillospiraceae bacterium]